MKKKSIYGLIGAIIAIVVVWLIFGHTPSSKVESKLKDNGVTEVQSVKIATEGITEWDHNAKPLQREAKPTLVVNVKYDSFTEANEKYKNAINEIYGHVTEYKSLATADYVLINIYRGSNLVAWMAINDKNERSYKIIETKYLASVGMGMSMSPEAYMKDKQIMEEVRQKGL